MSESAQIATVQSLLIILNIVGNSLVCAIVVKNQEMRTSINYLLMNLAVADMIVATFFAPAYILIHTFTHPDGVPGQVLCKLLTGGTFGWIGASASLFTLVAIAIERYYAVVQPHESKVRLSKRRLKVIIPCSWIFGAFMIIPWALALTFSKELKDCIEMWPEKWMSKSYSMIWFLLMALFPVSFMAVLYTRVVYTLWFKRGELSQQQGVMKVRKRVTLTVVIVSVIFGVCYLTNSSNYLMHYYYPSRAFLSLNAGSITVLFNSAINPIVYALVHERFREKFKKMMSCSCRPTTNMAHHGREPHMMHDQMMQLALVPTHPT